MAANIVRLATYRKTGRTCSVDHPVYNGITFVRNLGYFHRLHRSGVWINAFAPPEIFGRFADPGPCCKSIRVDNVILIQSENPEAKFVLFHNDINRDRPPKANDIDKTAVIHPTAIIGADGLKLVRINGGLVKMRHMGNVVIGVNTQIGPHAVIARGTLDSTVIGENCMIDANVHIAHNAQIGDRTIMIAQSGVAGSARIGSDCWIGYGAKIRNRVSICDRVLIGMGAVVVSDITEPGKYAGVPARRIGAWDGNLNA